MERVGTPVKGMEMPARSERAGTPVKGMEMPARSERAGTPVKPMETSGRSERIGTPMTPSRSAEPAAQQPKSAEPPPAKLMEPTQTFVRRPTSEMAAVASAAAVPYLTAVDGIRDGVKTFRLEQRDHLYMFGRTKRCEFRVKTSDVSREHASFTRRSDGIYVADLGSVNGVFVNNTRVSEFRLYDGDLIQIGHIKLRMFDPTETGRRLTDSAGHTPSRLAPHDHGMSGETAPPERSVSVHSDFHPAIAGALAAEGGHRHRRPSVRIMFTENWESSSKFRYGVVIIAAAVLAVCAVVIGFSILD
jgi:hypothetical protein